MEIEILKEDNEGLEIKILGEDHTFLNLLNSFLGKNEKVEYSAYKIDHPLIGEPKLFLRLKKLKKAEEVPVKKIKGVGPKTAEQLERAGVKTAAQLIISNPIKLAKKTGITEKNLQKYYAAAEKMVPKDRYGYRAVIKETLKEIQKTFGQLKKEFKEAQ